MVAAHRPRGAIRGSVAKAGIAAVEPLVTKYMEMLGIDGYPRPTIVIADNLGCGWLGEFEFNTLIRSDNTFIAGGRVHVCYADLKTLKLRVQRSILDHPLTLERTVSHEVVHLKNALEMTEAERDRSVMMRRLHISNDVFGHGKNFLRDAAVINAIMGDNFVTEKSDQSDVQGVCDKPYWIFIIPSDFRVVAKDKVVPRVLGYQYAVRLTPKMEATIARHTARGARLRKTTDRKWADRGRRIGVAVAVPPSEADQAQLRALYDEGEATSFNDLAQQGLSTGSVRAKNLYPWRVRERRIAEHIVAALDVRDLKKPYKDKHARGRCDAMTGHCHTASNAFFHAMGGLRGPYRPFIVEHEGGNHWFLVDMRDHSIVDLTASQFKKQPRYDRGKRGPAMQSNVGGDAYPTRAAERTLMRAGVINAARD